MAASAPDGWLLLLLTQLGWLLELVWMRLIGSSNKHLRFLLMAIACQNGKTRVISLADQLY